MVLVGCRNRLVAAGEFFPPDRQYPRRALNSRIKRAFLAQDHAPQLHKGERRGTRSETAPVLTMIGYHSGGMLSRDDMSTGVAQAGRICFIDSLAH